MLADLEGLEKRLPAAQKKARGGDKENATLAALMEPIAAALQAGRPARTAIPAGQEEAAKRLQLLTSKPVLYVCNVEEAAAATGNAQSRQVEALAKAEGARTVIVSAAIEAEVAQLPEAERGEFLEGLGLYDSGLDRVIRAGYDLLGLITYFTVGRRRPAPGRSCAAPARRRRPASSTVISSAGSSHQKRLPTRITTLAMARQARGRPASCVSRGATT